MVRTVTQKGPILNHAHLGLVQFRVTVVRVLVGRMGFS
jgi:hypothetical protein